MRAINESNYIKSFLHRKIEYLQEYLYLLSRNILKKGPVSDITYFRIDNTE